MNLFSTFAHPWALQSRTVPVAPWATLSTWPTLEAALAEQNRVCRHMGRLLRYRIVAR